MPAPFPDTIDRFELIEPLGEGGMGSVYRARDTVIDRLIALKVIDLGGFYSEAEQDEARARVLREARAAAALSHPHIVAVHDAGEEGDAAWIVQELVDGRPFRPGAQSAAETAELIKQAASALDYAHAHGVVHRDVKPSNLLIDAAGQAKLADFGIAKIVAADQMTRTGSLLGTPQYISPEQLHAREVGPRADQFSLAVVAYEALAGKKPFDAESIPALLAQILHAEPRPPSAVKPGLPAAADRVLMRALAKAPEDRYPSCGEFAEALSAAVAAPPAPPAEKPSRRFPRPAAAAIAIAAGLGGAWFILDGERSQPTTTTTPAADAVPPVRTSPAPAAGPPDAPDSAADAPQPIRPEPRETPPAAPPERPRDPAPVEPEVPAATPAPNAERSLGPAVSVVWSGSLEAGEELVVQQGRPSTGSLSRPWPTTPMEVEVSPSSVVVVERPSPSNNWSTLRLRADAAARSIVILRYRPIL